jgi:hypothetical protein
MSFKSQMNNEKAQAIQKAACTNLLIFCAINYSVKQHTAQLAEITRGDGKKRQMIFAKSNTKVLLAWFSNSFPFEVSAFFQT